jgi:hypothetical protein
MQYPKVSDIYQEIIGLVPTYKIAKDGTTTNGITQWTLPKNRKFRFGDRAVHPNLLNLQNYEILESLESLS